MANYVTPRGLKLLRKEMAELETERASLQARNRTHSDRARELAIVKGRITQLEERIASARLVNPADQPKDEVRFGATVHLESESGLERTVTVVGVDESSAEEGRITFLAPVAKRLTGKKVGDSVPMPTARGDQPFSIVSIRYS